MDLIESVAANVEAEFKKLWPYQDQGEFTRSREIQKEAAYFQTLGEMTEAERAERLKRQDDTYEDPRLAEARKKAGEKLVEGMEQHLLFRVVGEKISDELCRLTPTTYPKDDPETPRRMVDLLERISRSYTLEGKQRSAGPILEYLLAADYDHVFWLWNEWIAALIALGDHESAEALLAAATDGSSGAATHFAARGGPYKAKAMIAKAMIALRRDGDLERAHEIANNCRLTFGESKDAIMAFRGIEYIRQEVEAKRLTIAMNTGPNGAQVHQLVDARVPATALLTGKWEK